MWSWPADNDQTFPVDRALFYNNLYLIPKAKCGPGHSNVNSLNIAISHSLYLQSLHHNPHYHQHQGNLMLRWSLNFFCDVNRDLLRSFFVKKECRFLCHFFDMFNTKPTQWSKLASTKVTAAKTSLLKWIGVFSNFVAFLYFNSLKIANVG